MLILQLFTRDLTLFRKTRSNALSTEILLDFQVIFILKKLCCRLLEVILFIGKNDK